MAEKAEDLNLPIAVVTRIIKEALPENCNVAKEAKLALAKAASVFVLYLTSHANAVAINNGRKTISSKDVLEGLQEIEFGRFEETLVEAAEQYRNMQKNKKDSGRNKKQSKENIEPQEDQHASNEEVEISSKEELEVINEVITI